MSAQKEVRMGGQRKTAEGAPAAAGVAHARGEAARASLSPAARAAFRATGAPLSAAIVFCLQTGSLLFLALAVLEISAVFSPAAAGLGSSASGAVDTHLVRALLFAALSAVFAAAQHLSEQLGTQMAQTRLRERILLQVFHNPTLFSRANAEVFSASTQLAGRWAKYRASFRGSMFASFFAPLLILSIIAIRVDLWIACILLLCIPLVPLTILVFRRFTKTVSARYRRTQSELLRSCIEVISALETLVYLRAAERLVHGVAIRGEAHRKQLMGVLRINQLLIFVVDGIFTIVFIVVATCAIASRLATGAIAPDGAIAAFLLASLCLRPVDTVGQFFYVGMTGKIAQYRLASFFPFAQKTSRNACLDAAPDVVGTEEAVVFSQVSARWGRQQVLHNISFRVGHGEIFAITGESGRGKSTISAVLQGFLPPQTGRVFLYGRNISQMTREEIHRYMAVVEQKPYLFLGSIAENLRLARPEATEEELWDALDRVGLAEEVRQMEAGLETQVGQNGRNLSGGQAQRLAIARAWLKDAPLLLFDEPTSQVDLQREDQLLALLRKLTKDRTVILIAHRPEAILAADTVYEFSGEKQQEGVRL